MFRQANRRTPWLETATGPERCCRTPLSTVHPFFDGPGRGAARHPPRVLSSGKDDIMALTNNGKGMAGKDHPHMLNNEATFRQLMDFIQGLTTQEELAQNREKRRPSCEQLRKQYAPIARKTTRETCCEAFENGYAVFDQCVSDTRRNKRFAGADFTP